MRIDFEKFNLDVGSMIKSISSQSSVANRRITLIEKLYNYCNEQISSATSELAECRTELEGKERQLKKMKYKQDQSKLW